MPRPAPISKRRACSTATMSISGAVSALVTGLGSAGGSKSIPRRPRKRRSTPKPRQPSSRPPGQSRRRGREPPAVAAGLPGLRAGSDRRQQLVHHPDRFGQRHLHLRRLAMRVTQSLEQIAVLDGAQSARVDIWTDAESDLLGAVVHHGLAKPGRCRARHRLQPGPGAEPAVRHQFNSAQTSLNTEDTAITQVQNATAEPAQISRSRPTTARVAAGL